MDSIKIRTITPWKYYVLLIGFCPLWVLVPIFVVHANGGNKYFDYGTAFLLLFISISLAHILSRKWTTFSEEKRIIQFDNISITIDSMENYQINKSGIGVSQFEFKVKSGSTFKVLVPNYGKNSKRLEYFVTQACYGVKRIGQ